MDMIINKITDRLKGLELIEFAILFGSFSESKQTDLSDIDLGLFFSEEIKLLVLGNIITELTSITNKKVDVVILNDLNKKDPFFANEIITKGKILFCRNDNSFIEYRRKVFLEFLDTAYFREKIKTAFKNRLNENFGKRNYV